MPTDSVDLLPQSWITWFPTVEEAELRRCYQVWQRLNERRLAIARVLDRTRLLPKTERIIKVATKKLNYEVPYRIVVLGESGAGKSTLINALLGQNRLVTGAGGAVTGVPIYVHPLGSKDQERVVVTYRTAQEFSRLLHRIAARYGIPFPDDYDVGDQWIGEIIADASKVTSDRRLQLIEDIQDIVATWRRLESEGDLGKVQSFDLDADHGYLQDLMEERSELNKPGSSTRLIAGIARIDYYLRALSTKGDSTLQTNVVFIDTPGVGARTVRHQEILLEEVEQADAVILVVNARRPEDKTASLAYLLNQALLGDFTPEQKSHFAQKVFLVVNQIDAIQNAADRRRLEDSIRELCKIIDPSFWARHVAGEDVRYFETIAQLAVYAQMLNSGRKLDPQAESRYRGYLEQLLSEQEHQSADQHVIALKKSQIPLLRSKLTEFLGERRLHLMLDEAEALLQQVMPTALSESRTFFEKNGLVVDESLSAEIITDRNVRRLCEQQLKKDRGELLEQYREMWRAMQKWRRSDAYRKSLTAQVEEICRDVERRVRDWHDKALSDPDRFGGALDAVTGQEFLEMLSMEFLVEAERELRHIMEEEGKNLAAYYLREFREFIHSHGIHDTIQEKSYDQPYMRVKLDSITSLEDIEEEIEREFTDICRWVPVYELMQNPLVAVRDKSGKTVPKIAADVSACILDIALASFDVTGHSQMRVVIKGVSEWHKLRKRVRRQQSKEHTESGDESPTEQRMDSELEKLRLKIDEALLKWDLNLIKDLVVKELTLRSRRALGHSLPYLDMLFFYQLEKYGQVFNQIVDTIYEEHNNQVLDGNESIRQIIVRQNQATLVEAMELIRIVAELRAVA